MFTKQNFIPQHYKARSTFATCCESSEIEQVFSWSLTRKHLHKHLGERSLSCLNLKLFTSVSNPLFSFVLFLVECAVAQILTSKKMCNCPNARGPDWKCITSHACWTLGHWYAQITQWHQWCYCTKLHWGQGHSKSLLWTLNHVYVSVNSITKL